MSPRLAVVIVALASMLLWFVLRSPAAGLAVFGYGLAGAHALARRQQRRARSRARCDSLELLACACADLRAGSAMPLLVLPDRELDRLARAAQRISDRTGAPLADLLDRLERQQTALSRLDDSAHAHNTGLRTSAALLVALPLVGLALGHLIGANALGVLLHTAIGQTCLAAAMALQLAGLAWTDRLAHGPEARSVLKRRSRRLRSAVGGASSPGKLSAAALRHPFPARMGISPLPAPRLVRRVASRLGLAWPGLASPGGLALVRRRKRAMPSSRAQAVTHAELAVAADLVAASLKAGAPVSTAVLAAGETLAGPLSLPLLRIGHELRLGVPAGEAWQQLSGVRAAGRVIAAARRSAETGAALSGALTRCADDLRADAEHERQARAQRAAVLLVLPLGLCFLPAFMLAGLVPVVIAVLGDLL